jgi:hypothetical protein
MKSGYGRCMASLRTSFSLSEVQEMMLRDKEQKRPSRLKMLGERWRR